MPDMREQAPPAQHDDASRFARAAPRGAGTTVLAFDFGEQRTGAAVGDTTVGIAHPLTTITAEDKKTRYAAIAALVHEWRPALLVVGLPAHLDGAEHELSRLARKFARELGGRFNLPVELVDERLTSASAESSLAEAGVASRKRKPVIDQVAAQHILQAWLDEQARLAHLSETTQ
jgi:putative Holliday junction resolvase